MCNVPNGQADQNTADEKTVATDTSLHHALGLDHADGPEGVGLAVGAACRLSGEDAWEKAVLEGMQTLEWARALLATKGDPPRSDSFFRFEDHIHFWAHPRHAPDAAFLTADMSSFPLPPALSWDTCRRDRDAAQLDAVVQHLASQGFESFAFDVTSPDVRQAGYSVMRALVPDLCMLDLGSTTRNLGRPRLLSEAKRCGVDQFNPLPHPFP